MRSRRFWTRTCVQVPGTERPCILVGNAGEAEDVKYRILKQETTGSDFVLSRDEVVHFIELKARAARNMSGSQLLHAFRSGRLENAGEVAEALIMADLLPDDDPLLSGGAA